MDDTCLLRLRSTGEEPLMKAALESARTHPGTGPPDEGAPKEADERRVAWESQERGVAEELQPQERREQAIPAPSYARRPSPGQPCPVTSSARSRSHSPSC